MAINNLFEDIADAIRTAGATTDEYTPEEMPDAIRAISGGGGGGDMYKSDYDPDNTVEDAGGIVDYVAAQIAGKADSADVYTKTESDNLLAAKADSDDVYTKTESDNLLAAKADSDDVYTKTESDNLLAAKANISTITDIFDETVSYAAGDYFIDNNVIYHVDVPCTGITPPNAEYYTPNKLTDFIKANTSQISTVKQALSNEVVTRSKLTAHNILPISLDELVSINTTGSWSGKTYTNNGVTFVVNSDYSITVSTGAGGASSSSGLVLHDLKNVYNQVVDDFFYDNYKGESLILSGCPSGASGYNLAFNRYDDAQSSAIDTGAGVTFTFSNTKTSTGRSYVTIAVSSGTVITTPITFKPMIRLATDSDDTYQPYAMTNKELTSKVAPIACDKTTAGTYTLSATVDSDGNISYSWS